MLGGVELRLLLPGLPILWINEGREMTNRQILAWAKTVNFPCIFVPSGEIRPGKANWRKQLGKLSPDQRIALLAKISRQQARMQREQDKAKFQARQSA